MLNVNIDAEEVYAALHCIPPDLPHDEWVRVGMAYHAAGGNYETWNDWSSTAASYEQRAACEAWRSFKSGKGLGAGTLIHIAKKYGWCKNGSKLKQRLLQGPIRPAVPQHKSAPGMSPAEVWSRCNPATSAQPYVQAKAATGVPLDSLRVVPESDLLWITGQSMAGALVVPAYGPDGLQSLQLIPPPGAGKKLNLPGAPMAGATFTVGEVVPGGVTYVCEGIGTAWACWQATGHPAVVCFGWGNVARVTAHLRQQDNAARLVLVPDTGKEDSAFKIAADVGALVACMPEGEEHNFDANDLAQREGGDVLADLLNSASEPNETESKVHPLTIYVPIDGTAKPPRWVIPGFIGHGVTVIAGAHGVGKTTAILPLAMTAAGLHGADLLPRQWRHVVYVTEDVEQARRILAGIVLHGNLSISLEAVRERMHLVEAVRLDPTFVASAGTTYREQFTRTVDGVEVLPLVVLDTKSAVLALENENDNSEASRMMAALKQGFDGLPVWLIGHVSKANLTRNDAVTSRGASAIEGDANQTMFLIREGESRYLVQGKTRFESRWPELEITSYTAHATEPDEFGYMEAVLLRWGIARPAQQSRKEATEQATEHQRKKDEAALRQDIRDAVQVAWLTGNPLNRAGVKAKIRRKASDVLATLENLLNERWLHEVNVPAAVRLVNSKAVFLVNLTTEEHEAVVSGAGIPTDKLAIPASWQKQAVSPVPAQESEVGEVDHAQP